MWSPSVVRRTILTLVLVSASPDQGFMPFSAAGPEPLRFPHPRSFRTFDRLSRSGACIEERKELEGN
jgi:hypothetical protein